MSILSDAQKSALFGRLLGLPQTTADVAPERSAPSGTIAGTEPAVLGAMSQSRIVQYVAIGAAIVAVVYVARKLL